MSDFICTQCGFTWDEYRSRGLLGCPHCYASLGEALLADVAWLHGALAFAQPETAGAAADPGPGAGAALRPDPESLARWREQISEAVRAENYEEAARLNRLILGQTPQRPGLGFA
ncbi:MAG: hypothetical protein ABI036_12070 [Fibrobacteria bacterium]